MKKILNKVRDAQYALGAAITVALISAEEAMAAKTVGDAATALNTQAGAIGKLMIAGSFVGGIVMLGSGLMKLKQAADTQGNQVKYSEGMWRVGVGAGLVAIPAFGGMLTETFSLGSVTMSDRGGVSF
jgi:hypothetical protein|nr:hypothetical protein [Neorhizobium tomejilense]